MPLNPMQWSEVFFTESHYPPNKLSGILMCPFYRQKPEISKQQNSLRNRYQTLGK